MKKRAILSVHDKTGLTDLSAGLLSLGWELIASDGTARVLREAGMTVRTVSDLTGAPELLGGRVKTLHPAIHAGILARNRAEDDADLAAHGIEHIDLVVCNLYPFAATVARLAAERDAAAGSQSGAISEAVEQIDIGGVTLLRAAAKNFERVAVLCDPDDYPAALDALRSGGMDAPTRRALAVKAFTHTRDYDAAVSGWLAELVGGPGGPDAMGKTVPDVLGGLPETITLSLHKTSDLRYGENPHQSAALYATVPDGGPLGGRLLQGKELSYNNLLDLDAAWQAAASFDEPAVVIVKHLSPCGVAIGRTIAEAFPAALASDPVSAFGGVIAANRTVDSAFVETLEEANLFVEAIVAPAFTPEAADRLAARKKNCRLVTLEGTKVSAGVEWRAVRGGILVQTPDGGDPPEAVWRVVSRRSPTGPESSALRFAWIACRHVKSNAIVLASETATVGIGGGLPSRVDAVKLAVAKAGQRAAGAVMASDAFFPFADGLEAAAAAGVTAVIEPGGSVRDEEVIAAADRLGLALVFTGARHFRH